MPLIIKRKPIDYAALESGTYIAHCQGIALVGTQMHENAKNKVPTYKRDIYFVFEVCGQSRKHKNGDPYMMTVNGKEIPEPQTVRKEVTESLGVNSNMTKILAQWMSASDVSEFDLEECVGKSCVLSVEKSVSDATGNEYNKVTGISAMIAGMEAPPAILPTFAYSVDEHTDEAFAKLPEWLQDVVKKSSEWEAAHANSETIDTATISAHPTTTTTGGPAF